MDGSIKPLDSQNPSDELDVNNPLVAMAMINKAVQHKDAATGLAALKAIRMRLNATKDKAKS